MIPFGLLASSRTRAQQCEFIIDQLIKIVGSTGTVVFPTFTCSFGKTLAHLLSTSICGMLSDYAITNQNFKRTIDPSLSVSSYGPLSTKLMKLNHSSPYSQSGLFQFLLDHNFLILGLNRLPVSTIMHYSEFVFGVSYRFVKRFTGLINLPGSEPYHCDSNLFVRHLNINCTPNFKALDHRLSQLGLSRYSVIGKGFASICSCIDNHSVALDMLDYSETSLIFKEL